MDYRWRRGGLTISALTPGREDWLRDLAESSCIVRHDVRDSLFFLLIQILEFTQQLSGVTVEQYEVYSWSSVAAFTIYAHLLIAWDADLWWKVSKDIFYEQVLAQMITFPTLVSFVSFRYFQSAVVLTSKFI